MTRRAQCTLPALASASWQFGASQTLTVGLRKAGDPTPAQRADKWHYGSLTKAMTATVAAVLIERGHFTWETTLPQALPELAARMHPQHGETTLAMMAAHMAGFAQDVLHVDDGTLARYLRAPETTPVQGRLRIAEALLTRPPAQAPNTAFTYSNGGYLILGSVMEFATQKPWEELMLHELFVPLGMHSCGFGVQASHAVPADAPWPHVWDAEICTPEAPNPDADNPPAWGPGGRVHGSLEEYGKFLQVHLDGFWGRPTPLLPASSFRRLHEAWPGQTYTPGGWYRVHRDWAKGDTFNHNGSNPLNFAAVWWAPAVDHALISVTNVGGGGQGG